MKQTFQNLSFSTSSSIQCVDLTERVREAVRASGIHDGAVTIVSRHTTGGIAINERDEALQRDMVDWLTRQFPAGAAYRHDAAPVDDRPNTHAHLAGLVLRASETLLVRNGALEIGAWQSIFFVEVDGPRPREVALRVHGA